MTITTIIESGDHTIYDRLHLGYGDGAQKMGTSIRLHTNSLSKFFGCLFNKIINVEIDGVLYKANRNSFNKHLTSIGLKKVASTTEFLVYNQLIKDKPLKIDHQSMVTGLSSTWRWNMTHKMGIAILLNDKAGVEQCIRQGASLNKILYYNKSYDLDQYISPARNCREWGGYDAGTPLALALLLGHKTIAARLAQIKNQDYSTDSLERYTTEFVQGRTCAKFSQRAHVVFENNELALRFTDAT